MYGYGQWWNCALVLGGEGGRAGDFARTSLYACSLEKLPGLEEFPFLPCICLSSWDLGNRSSLLRCDHSFGRLLDLNVAHAIASMFEASVWALPSTPLEYESATSPFHK